MSLGNCAVLKWVAQKSRRVILSEADVGFVLLGADIVVRYFEDKYSGFSIAIQVFLQYCCVFAWGRGVSDGVVVLPVRLAGMKQCQSTGIGRHPAAASICATTTALLCSLSWEEYSNVTFGLSAIVLSRAPNAGLASSSAL